jgi:hypothetical protein
MATTTPLSQAAQTPEPPDPQEAPPPAPGRNQEEAPVYLGDQVALLVWVAGVALILLYNLANLLAGVLRKPG